MATTILLVLALTLLTLPCFDASSNSCQDIDHAACVAMSYQNPNLCSDPTLASAVCPSLCDNCPVNCYKCNVTSMDVSNCITETCQNNMICMARDITSARSVNHMYFLQCSPKSECHNQRKRFLQSGDVSTVHCCKSDLCNSPQKLMTTAMTSSTSTTSSTTSTTTTTTTTRPTTTPTTTRTTTTRPTTPSTTTTTTTIPRPTTSPAHTSPPTTVCTRDIIFVVDQSRHFEAGVYPVLRESLARLFSLINIVCTRDIIFVVDQSRHFEAGVYPVLRESLARLFSLINIGDWPTAVMTSLLTFDATLYTHWSFTDYASHNKARALANLRALSAYIPRSSNTIWWEAARLLSGWHTNYIHGDRPYVKDVLVFIAGHDTSHFSGSDLLAMSTNLHNVYDHVVTIGIGYDVQRTLAFLAKDPYHALFLTNPFEMQRFDVQTKILQLICG